MAKRSSLILTASLLVLAVAIAGGWFYLRSGPETATNRESIRIGVALPLSGDMAVYGENGREGLLLAKESLESSYPELEIDLEFQDTQTTPTGTVTAVRRLIDVHGVKYIIGGLTSTGVLAAAPYAQERGVLFFSPAASAPGIPDIGDLVFRNWQSDTALADLFGEAAGNRLGLQSIAILHVSNDYGHTNAETFRESFEATGGEVPLVRAMSKGTTEVKTLVTQIRGQEGIDGLLLAVYPDEYKVLFQEFGSAGLPGIQILATDTFYSPDLLAELGASAGGTVCAVASKPSEGYEPRKKFIREYKQRFQTEQGQPQEPGLVSDTAYDALHLVVEGVRATTVDPQEVADFLLQLNGYPGAAGPTTFLENGDVEGGISLFRVQGGEFIPVRE